LNLPGPYFDTGENVSRNFRCSRGKFPGLRIPDREFNPPPTNGAASGVTSSRDFWGAHLAPFLEKHFFVLTLCLIAIACARIISTYNALSFTVDEPEHFAAGLEYVANHVYRLQTQHAPLSRAFQAVGPYLAGARPTGLTVPSEESYSILSRVGNINRTIFLMRLGNLPFFVLACLVVCGWAWHTFGKPVAAVATGLFTLLPTVLADAGLATPDMAVTATVSAAFFAAILWAERPTVWRSLVWGLFMGLACLARFTALGYIPTAICIGLAFHLAISWPGWKGLVESARRRAVPFALALGIAGLAIWGGYWFTVGSAGSGVMGIHLGRNLILPAPEFFDGLRKALQHNREGHAAFLLGQFRTTGWWYYYPVALAVKTPIAFLILLAVGLFVDLRGRKCSNWLLPLAFCLGILLPALRSRIDIGVRHVGPIYVGFAIIAALGLKYLLQWDRARVIGILAGGVLVGWMAISGAVQHPDYLAYFNALAGKTPEDVLVDSNYDWDQDMRFLSKRLRELGVKEFSLTLWQGVRFSDYREAWYGLPKIKKTFDFCVPTPGWSVVSPTFDRAAKFNLYGPGLSQPPCVMSPWYHRVKPTERVGPLRLYYVANPTQRPSPVEVGTRKEP
jgi:hypothetical protein